MTTNPPKIKKANGKVLIGDEVFLDVRCGITWPHINNAGYFSIWGLKRDRNTYGDHPVLCLLYEAEAKDREALYEAFIIKMKQYGATWAFANLDEPYEIHRYSLNRFMKRRNLSGALLIDASEFSSFESAHPLLSELLRKQLIQTDYNTSSRLCWAEIHSARRQEALSRKENRRPEELFPAMNALNHVVMSYELYPYKRKKQPWR